MYIHAEEIQIGYYSDKLSSARLKMVYEIAPPRVRQYLRAEIDFVRAKINPGDMVLDLGCGYGRSLPAFAGDSLMTVGVDSSLASLLSASDVARNLHACYVARMDAATLAFRDHSFDKVICIQNGISAFQLDRQRLIAECARITRPGGMVIFSTYSERFWDDRLEWFRLQAKAGLLGEIDLDKTGNGVIICRDGFKATTVSAEEFFSLATGLNLPCKITEVDESSLFCEINV